MTKFINAALLATLLVTGASATGAHAAKRHAATAHSQQWTDLSAPHGGYAPNSPEGNRAFWDYQGRQGSNN